MDRNMMMVDGARVLLGSAVGALKEARIKFGDPAVQAAIDVELEVLTRSRARLQFLLAAEERIRSLVTRERRHPDAPGGRYIEIVPQPIDFKQPADTRLSSLFGETLAAVRHKYEASVENGLAEAVEKGMNLAVSSFFQEGFEMKWLIRFIPRDLPTIPVLPEEAKLGLTWTLYQTAQPAISVSGARESKEKQ